jgi:Endoribonuclease L-PSP
MLNYTDFDGKNEQFKNDAEEIEFILDNLSSFVNLKSLAIAVNLYISDMTSFAALNKVYQTFFGIKPPTRACVQL